MGKAEGKLTAAGVKALSKPGMHSDGRTLYLNVARGGSKSWIQRIAIKGRRHDIGLGPYPAVGLSQARRRAADNRAAVADERDPLAEKRRAAAPTFREAAERTFEAHKPRWRSDHYTRNWMRSMEKYAFACLGDMPVDQIGREDVLSVLAPIWGVRIETARKLRQRIRTVLRWAQAHGYVEHNVAGDLIDGALPSMPAVREHFRALSYADVPEALRIVEASSASLAVRLCFRFTVLTAARGGEARGATWAEVNLDAQEWRIPRSRMKGGVGHRQPLSNSALAVLEEARPLRDESDLIFPSPSRRDQPLSDMAMTKLLRDVGLADRTTMHGFRSSVSGLGPPSARTRHTQSWSYAWHIASGTPRSERTREAICSRNAGH